MILSGCTALELRDSAAEKGRLLDAAYTVALMDVVQQRQKWRERCADLREMLFVVSTTDLTTVESVEAAIAAHNKNLPKVETALALTDGDGSLLSHVNRVTC
jgi:uncharacterized protein involved in tolerance to divalent cations